MFDPALIDRAAALLALCRERGLKLATAESCTGGLIAHLLTAIAGVSARYGGSQAAPACASIVASAPRCWLRAASGRGRTSRRAALGLCWDALSVPASSSKTTRRPRGKTSVPDGRRSAG